MNNSNKINSCHQGECLCGAVSFEMSKIIRQVVNCHCSMCRITHGTYGPYTKAMWKDIHFTKKEGLKWYDSSDIAQRGFCKNCGSSLFWKPNFGESVGVSAGCLKDSSRLHTIAHIFVASKAPFYKINDDLIQFPDSSKGQIPETEI